MGVAGTLQSNTDMRGYMGIPRSSSGRGYLVSGYIHSLYFRD